jgi:hypothetical protein
MACAVLGDITGVERVWNLPAGGPSYAVVASSFVSLSDWRDLPTRPLERAVLRDNWGKLYMGHKLDGYRTVKLSAQGVPRSSVTEVLDPNLQLVRCRRGEGGLSCQMSDGSELVCTGVIFADGPRSRGRDLMERVARQKLDPRGVACWSFVRSDLLDLKSWEFRTALGKSVEQLPLPEGKVRVKLRFRTAFGARQSVAELKDLFSEFGADMEALFEGVEVADIGYWEEEEPAKVAFSPLPGTLALGEAALGVPLLGTFDWAGQLVKRQLERVVESVLAEHWDPTAWEPLCQEALKPLLDSERYLRGGLHYDNALIRPLRDLALRWLPAGVLVERVKGRLGF